MFNLQHHFLAAASLGTIYSLIHLDRMLLNYSSSWVRLTLSPETMMIIWCHFRNFTGLASCCTQTTWQKRIVSQQPQAMYSPLLINCQSFVPWESLVSWSHFSTKLTKALVLSPSTIVLQANFEHFVHVTNAVDHPASISRIFTTGTSVFLPLLGLL